MKFDLIAAYRALEEALPDNEVRIRVARRAKHKIELRFECMVFTGWVDVTWAFTDETTYEELNAEFNKMIAKLQEQADQYNKNWPPANRSRKEGDHI